MPLECPDDNKKDDLVFIAKDDGLEKRVSLLVQGKHGTIGYIRPIKPKTERERQMILESLVNVTIETTMCHMKNEEKAQEN